MSKIPNRTAYNVMTYFTWRSPEFKRQRKELAASPKAHAAVGGDLEIIGAPIGTPAPMSLDVGAEQFGMLWHAASQSHGLRYTKILFRMIQPSPIGEFSQPHEI